MGLEVDLFENRFFIGRGRVGYLGVSLDVFLYNVDGLLIDTGPSRLARAIKPFLLAFPPREVVITHIHEDHCGMAFWINSVYPDVPIYVHKDVVGMVSMETKLPLYRRLFWGRRRSFSARPYPEILETEKYAFKIIPVGGHSNDHTILYEPQRGWLFVGDLFLTTRPIVMFHEEKALKTLEALNIMLSLDFSTLFCSHSGYHRNGREIIAKKKEYLEDIAEKVRKLREKGYSIKEIDKILFPKKPMIVAISRGEWSSLNLIRSLES